MRVTRFCTNSTRSMASDLVEFVQKKSWSLFQFNEGEIVDEIVEEILDGEDDEETQRTKRSPKRPQSRRRPNKKGNGFWHRWFNSGPMGPSRR